MFFFLFIEIVMLIVFCLGVLVVVFILFWSCRWVFVILIGKVIDFDVMVDVVVRFSCKVKFFFVLEDFIV